MPPKQKPQSQAAQSRFFDLLPRELRDYIYEIAFGIQPRTVKVVTREKWECREEQLSEQRKKYRYMGGYYASRKVLKPALFPANPMKQMTVCKQFYDEASARFLKRATLQFRDGYGPTEFNRFITPMVSSQHIQSITAVLMDGFIGSIEQHRSSFANLKLCTGIRELYVTVSCMNLRSYSYDEEDADFRRMRPVQDIIAAKSLRSVILTPADYDDDFSLEQNEQFAKKVAALNKFIMAELKLDRSHGLDKRPSTRPRLMRACKRVKLSE